MVLKSSTFINMNKALVYHILNYLMSTLVTICTGFLGLKLPLNIFHGGNFGSELLRSELILLAAFPALLLSSTAF